MKILVGQHELKIDKKDKVNQNEYKVTKCEFEFDEEITNDLVKIALFTNSAGTYKQYIINNECDIPAEILEKQETTTLGVYAYKEENEELELRYSPEEIKFYVSNGSYKENAENTEPITPTDKEQMEQLLQNGLNDINNKIDEVDEKLDGIETAIEETNNLNLDVSDKVDGDVTVTLTKKDASTKTVVLSDGTSLEFNWDGTKLGIKTSGEEEYTYVDLQGIQGPAGPQGEAFRIKKTYPSVAEMNADFNNMEYGDYVMIASSVEVEDNAKLYTRGESQWIFITDFSGATGIRGETGLTPSIQIGTVVSGSTPSVTRTGTDENPVLNFVLQKGDKGNVGPTGLTGNGISSIEKTSTSGLVDTYTITYTNGNTTTFDVSNGNGIDRIEKTATVGNKDTYTIYFTNGSTTTYEVANGEVTREELEEEVERLSMIYNAFPTTTGEGEEPSINGTAEVPFKEIGLKGNTSQDGEPTPDTPISVNVVTGDNSITISNGDNTQSQTYPINLGSMELCKIGDYQDVIKRSSGKNLIDLNKHTNTLASNTTILSSNSYKCESTGDWQGKVDLSFTDLKPNTDYTFSMGATQSRAILSNVIGIKDGVSTTLVQSIYVPYLPRTFNTSDYDTITMTLYARGNVGSNETITVYNVMLNEGSTALPYEPYGKVWCKYGAIGKVVLDGSENWVYPTQVGSSTYYRYENQAFRDNDCMVHSQYLSDNFKYNGTISQVEQNVITNISIAGTNKLWITIDTSLMSGTTKNDFKNWLSTHNTTVYYVLTTPTTTEITDTTLIEQLDNLEKAYSYDTQTNISQTNQDKPFIISYEAILSLKNVLNS